MINIANDFQSWLKNSQNKLYRYLVLKKFFTPYEQAKAFEDQSIYEDIYYQLCKIEEAVDLGNGDWMLGLRTIGDDGMIYGTVHYYKLSEIRLTSFDADQELQLYAEENDE